MTALPLHAISPYFETVKFFKKHEIFIECMGI